MTTQQKGKVPAAGKVQAPSGAKKELGIQLREVIPQEELFIFVWT